MAANSLQLALAALEAQVVNANIPGLPATEWSEEYRTKEGIYLLDIGAKQSYRTIGAYHPTNATANVRAVVLLSKKKLDALVDGKPKQALALLYGAIKEWCEAKNADGTWQAAVEGLTVVLTDGPMDYVEGQTMGFLGLSFLLEGFDID